jgi:chromate transporter
VKNSKSQPTQHARTNSSNLKHALSLFPIFLRIGAFTFGGGFAMIPSIRIELVERRSYMSDEEFVAALAWVQSAPGPIALNIAVFTGFNIAGLLGSIFAALGVVLPSFVLILGIAIVFGTIRENVIVASAFKGIAPTVVGLILTAAVDLKRWFVKCHTDALVVIGGFFALVLGVHPIIVILTMFSCNMLWRKTRRHAL